MDNENIEKKDSVIERVISKEMKQAYMEYAMSVIVSRALPDARDGLKPVHRRILYAMHESGLTSNKPYRKSAATVGDVLGKYHPHGDSSVYDAMVRLAQDFSMRYTLIDGHGNFGSIDGDGAAAYRYTEARMEKICEEILADIDKKTVDFMPNYNNELEEPTVLPTKVPVLLVNGSSGIAVGMATNMAPHNLSEVIDGIREYIKNNEITNEELMQYIKGPDFPTGGLIMGKKEIIEAYTTGKGKIQMRGEASIENMTGSKQKIVITSIPYQVNKSLLIQKIADLVKEKRIEGISEVRDESDRDAMVRIVIELKRDVNARVVLNLLYKYTQLQSTFGIINLALVNGEPKLLTLKDIIEIFVKHRKEVIVRRSKFELEKTEARLHILEGLRIAIDNIEEVIKIIRSAYDDAKERLMERFGFTDIQAQAILDMRLKTLSGLQIEKINEEFEKLSKYAEELRLILSSIEKQLEIILEELEEIKQKYGDERKTKIVPKEDEIEIEDLIAEETSIIALTSQGYIKRMPVDTYKSQNRGGKGIIGITTKENDFVKEIFTASTHDTVLFFTSKGKLYKMMGYEIPESGRTARGTAIVNLIALDPDEKVTAIKPVSNFSDKESLLMATKNGVVKKTNLSEYATVRTTGLKAISLDEGDELISVKSTSGDDNVILTSRKGKIIIFTEDQVKEQGRNTRGVRGIKLSEGDYVIGMEVNKDSNVSLLAITENGFGKRTEISEYSPQARGGKGVLTYKITGKTGELVGIRAISGTEDVMLITNDGTVIRLKCKNISILSRATMGVTLIRTNKDSKVVSFEIVDPVEDKE